MRMLFVQKMNGISGSELYLLQIMPELKRRGYDIEMLIVYPSNGDKNGRFIEYLGEHGIKTHEIYEHFDFSPFLVGRISRLIRKCNYDIVQVNLVHADLWVSVIKFLFQRKLKVVSVKHGYYPAYQAKYGYDFRFLKWNFYYWIEKFVCRTVNFNVTISKGLYNVYVEGGITTPKRIKNIYYGLTLAKPVEQSSAEVPQGDFALITGRLVSFKGHKYLIKAWKKVRQSHPGLKLVIAGGGECREQLEKMSSEEGVSDSVLFLGHVPNPHPLMAKCCFTIVSSTWEGFGLILLESWLHKKPIVAFDVPAMNEVVKDGENGLLARANDSEDLADKIVTLYNNKTDIMQYGENGYKKLHDFFTLKRMTDEMEQVYSSVYENNPVSLSELTP
ncbi:MAG: glycosyltransferase family 4 protein [Chitinophagaceae bacterium]